MRFRISHLLLTAILAIASFWPLPLSAQQSYSEKDELAWRQQHVADLQKPDGWLSLIGLEWLEPGDTTIGSAKDNKIRLPESGAAYVAVLRLERDSVELLPPKDGFPAGLYVDGVPATEQ